MDQNYLKELREKFRDLNIKMNVDDSEFDYDMIKDEYDLDIKKLEQDMMENVTKLELGYKVLNLNAVKPSYNYDGDSGFDLYSTERIVVQPFGRCLVPTGLSFQIKDGYEIQVRSKSGLAINQGLMVLNSPGTVDSSYTGEIKVIIFNTNNHEFVIEKGMKVGQAVLSPVVNGKWVDLVEKNTLNETDRGSNGFGSTGI